MMPKTPCASCKHWDINMYHIADKTIAVCSEWPTGISWDIIDCIEDSACYNSRSSHHHNRIVRSCTRRQTIRSTAWWICSVGSGWQPLYISLLLHEFPGYPHLAGSDIYRDPNHSDRQHATLAAVRSNRWIGSSE